ncbi:MAG: ATP-binding protein [Chlamydiia bacterium]|nr:ATP-binding protein [Chlamydiia bacterium]
MPEVLTAKAQLFSAELEQLPKMLEFIFNSSCCKKFSKKELGQIELALEEACVNITQYAYPRKKGTLKLMYEPTTERPGVKIYIQDWGIPYNPIEEAKKFSKTQVTQQKKLGGLGVFFIISLMDNATYIREHGRNILILTKYLSPQRGHTQSI